MSDSISLTRTTRFTVDLDEEYAHKIYNALHGTLAQFDTTDRRYVELVNKGHIDTLCVLRNMFAEEFS
jgi:hypothetical protein